MVNVFEKDEELFFVGDGFNGFNDNGLMLYNLFVLIFIQFKLVEIKRIWRAKPIKIKYYDEQNSHTGRVFS